MKTTLTLLSVLAGWAVLEEAPRVLSVAMQNIATVIGHGHQVAEKKVKGEYKLVSRIIIVKGGISVVTMLFADPLEKMVFPMEIGCTKKGAEKLQKVHSLDLIEDKDGNVIEVILYGDGIEPMSIKQGKKPAPPDITALQPQPNHLDYVRGVCF